jgi:hypothetical protein
MTLELVWNGQPCFPDGRPSATTKTISRASHPLDAGGDGRDLPQRSNEPSPSLRAGW